MESWCEANKSCGAMPLGEDGVVIGAATASSTSRGGRCVRQEYMVMDAGAAMASVQARCAAPRLCRQVAAGEPREDWRIKIRRENVRFNLDSCICIFSLLLLCMLHRLESS